jgi:hypothetical protein
LPLSPRHVSLSSDHSGAPALWNRLKLLLLSCSFADHQRSFFLREYSVVSVPRGLSVSFRGVSLERPLKKSMCENSIPEVATHQPGRTSKHEQISRCWSRTLYRHSPLRDMLMRQRKDAPRRPRSKHAQGRSNNFLVSWKTRAGVTLAAAPRSEVVPARVAALFHFLEGSEKTERRPE